MEKSEACTGPVAIRFTLGERQAIAGLAAVAGQSISAYLRSVILGKVEKPLPVLAASSELLAAAQMLSRIAEAIGDEDAKALVSECSRKVLAILRNHGPAGFQE